MGLKYLVFGQLLPVPASFGSQPEWLYWLQYFFTGRPFPFGGMDVLLHPVAFAGWAGILITALNLIPAGQFDGGHVVYTLFGRKVQKRIFPILLIVLALMGLFWVGWWIWIVLIFFLGRVHAETLDQITELDDKRRRIGMFAILVFILVFTPVPLNLML
jgi:membrane-associated protease RseP (regulator of RpoE activity)